MVITWALVMVLFGLFPSEIPLSFAQACALLYHFFPPVRSASSHLAKAVQSWARVAAASGAKVVLLFPFINPRELTKSIESFALCFLVSVNFFALSTIFTVVSSSIVNRIPFFAATDFFTISSVPSALTRTTTVPAVIFFTGMSTLAFLAFSGSLIVTVDADSIFLPAFTSTGSFTALPDFSAFAIAFSLICTSAVIVPFLSFSIVAVVPSASLMSG